MAKVFKFGGSTIKDASTIKNITQIISSESDVHLVVLSATFNSTNELEFIANNFQNTLLQTELINDFVKKHEVLCLDLGISTDVCKSLRQELEDCAHRIISHGGLRPEELDRVYSCGEIISSKIVFEYMKEQKMSVNYLDARSVIRTNKDFNQATPLMFEIRENCKKLDKNKCYITQGFIGESFDGETTTLGREGSDYTASLLAWGSDSDKLTLWKDVDGIYQADPKKCASAKKLDRLTYEEANHLTRAGAKVLFPRTVNPLIEKNIQIEVKSVLSPSNEGTIISNDSNNTIIGVTTREHRDGVIVSIVGNNLFSNKKTLDFIDTNKSLYLKSFEFTNNCLSFLVEGDQAQDTFAQVGNYYLS